MAAHFGLVWQKMQTTLHRTCDQIYTGCNSSWGAQATLVGQRVWVFGGEDSLRRPLGDLHVLDLATMEWGVPATTGRPPQPRSAHTAISYRDRWLLIFGGGSLVRPTACALHHLASRTEAL